MPNRLSRRDLLLGSTYLIFSSASLFAENVDGSWRRDFHGASTSAFNQAIKRNDDRFPADFKFQLTLEEASLLKSQSVTSSWGGKKIDQQR